MDPNALLEQALRHHQNGDLAAAERCCRQVLAADPRHAAAAHFLGVIALQVGKPRLAAELIRGALQHDPLQAEFHNNLGQALTALGQHEVAIASYQEAIRLRPNYAKAHHNLGVTLLAANRPDAALAAFTRATEIAPTWVQGHRARGDHLKDVGRYEEAVSAYRTALDLAPHTPEITTNLAVALRQLGRHEEAIAVLRAALQVHPEFRPAQINLALILREQGDVAASLAAYRAALRGGPIPAHLHSGYLFLLHVEPTCGPAQLLAEHQTWAQQHAAPLRSEIRAHTNRADPERPLRIGYVSADLREHPVGRNMHPLLAHHDRRQFEIHAYAQVDEPDALSARLRGLVSQWHDVGGIEDEELAERIRRDRIDILVDLSLHTDGNRLLVFARRPAPLQVTFAGYPGTTGVDTIDYRLTDPFLDPPGTRDALYVERSIRLPHAFWCFDPLEATAAPAPRTPAAPLAWGCLNNPLRIHAGVLDCWGRILQETPGSRLVVLAHNEYHRTRITEALGRHGIDRARLEFVSKQPRAAYLETYRRCDIILDTWPYNGHTSMCEALWMGVPVVTLVGETAVGRGGFSLLSNLGLTELAANNPDAYVAKALALARDRPRLAALHADLRPRMEKSPLMDGAAFARGIEAAYRTMWRSWCAQRTRHESA